MFYDKMKNLRLARKTATVFVVLAVLLMIVVFSGSVDSYSLVSVEEHVFDGTLHTVTVYEDTIGNRRVIVISPYEKVITYASSPCLDGDQVIRYYEIDLITGETNEGAIVVDERYTMQLCKPR